MRHSRAHAYHAVIQCAFEFKYACTAHHHLACTVCWTDNAQQDAGAIVRAWPLCPRPFCQPYPVMLSFALVEAWASGDFVHGRSPQARTCRGTCEWSWPLCPRAFRQPYPVMLSFAHVEACASGDFVHGRSLQARACRGTCEWRLRPWAEASRIAPALTSGRSPETSRPSGL